MEIVLSLTGHMGSNPIISATSEWTSLHSDFLFHKKSVITLRNSSSSTKGHVRVGYSLASALITPLAHYQPFAVCALRRSCFPCSSSSAKGHVRVGYAFASARITPLAHYQSFAVCALQRYCFPCSSSSVKSHVQLAFFLFCAVNLFS